MHVTLLVPTDENSLRCLSLCFIIAFTFFDIFTNVHFILVDCVSRLLHFLANDDVVVDTLLALSLTWSTLPGLWSWLAADTILFTSAESRLAEVLDVQSCKITGNASSVCC